MEFKRLRAVSAAFTLVEGMVALALIGIGMATVLPALMRMNYVASTSRNATGAYIACQRQIDAILTNGPFNPRKSQIPAELTLGTTVAPTAPVIYQDPTTGTTFLGAMTTAVADVSTASAYVYRATVTVSWQFNGKGPIWSTARNRWEYQVTMSTLRASDV